MESGLGGESAVIKSHHNVGGLPEHVDFKDIVEPLRNLFKDEVRKVGLELGLPDYLVFRQPFPGPGLESVSSAKSQPKRYALSRMQTGFTEAKWKRQQKSTKRPTARNHHGCQTSTLQPLPICVQ